MELCCSYARFAAVGVHACIYGGLWNATTKFLARLFNDLLGAELPDLKDGSRLQPMMITSIMAQPDGGNCDHGMSVSISLPTRVWLLKDGARAAKLATAAMQEAVWLVYPEFAVGGAWTAGVVWNAQAGLTGITACSFTCACLGTHGGSPLGSDAGFELSAHNLDHAWEQLVIFAGLATLWNLAEEQFAMK